MSSRLCSSGPVTHRTNKAQPVFVGRRDRDRFDPERLESAMSSSTTDKIKGFVKELAGKVTGDKKLETEGKADKLKGDVKGAVRDVADAARAADKPNKDRP